MTVKVFHNTENNSYWMQVGNALIWIPQKTALWVAEKNELELQYVSGQKEMQIICNNK